MFIGTYEPFVFLFYPANFDIDIAVNFSQV